LPTERPLHRQTVVTAIDSGDVQDGSGEFDASVLVSQISIDRADLLRRVWDTLGPRDQVALRDVVADAPLEHGLAELVGYLSLIEPGLAVVFDDLRREHIAWSAEDVERVAELPRVSFSRDRSEPR
jgi:hypothetical protein